VRPRSAARWSATCSRQLVGYKTAQELKGAADAKADRHLRARLRNKDAEFYQFWRSLETLSQSLDEKAWLILSTDSELLQYLKTSGR
jgi:regulator of protease activity HflC (stomatin/prohibitin superfamily)